MTTWFSQSPTINEAERIIKIEEPLPLKVFLFYWKTHLLPSGAQTKQDEKLSLEIIWLTRWSVLFLLIKSQYFDNFEFWHLISWVHMLLNMIDWWIDQNHKNWSIKWIHEKLDLILSIFLQWDTFNNWLKCVIISK